MVSKPLLEKRGDLISMGDFNFVIVRQHYYSLINDVVEIQHLSCIYSMAMGSIVDHILNLVI